MTYTGGIAGDSPELSSHIDALLQMNAKIDEYRLDDAYDSFQSLRRRFCEASVKKIRALERILF